MIVTVNHTLYSEDIVMNREDYTEGHCSWVEGESEMKENVNHKESLVDIIINRQDCTKGHCSWVDKEGEIVSYRQPRIRKIVFF